MPRDNDEIGNVLDRTFQAFDKALVGPGPELAILESGVVMAVSAGIARVSGLDSAEFGELIEIEDGSIGMVFNLETTNIAVVLLNEKDGLSAGMLAKRTGRVADVPVGDGILGRVIDPIARPLDGKGQINYSKRLPVERDSPGIMDRAPVNVPLNTGIKVIDTLIPIGRGQRELILGDRQTGKTTIAVDAILNQTDPNMVCVYCAIGQRSAAVAKVVADLKAADAMQRCIVVVAEGNDAPGLRYLAPYAATSIAESFMLQGKDVVIVYDDLTNHARSYREISLLLRRPPGREAFPGDIFYLHSRLLERATHLRKELGGGSMTALPVVETEAQDISAYIPTNLISITDGQIYLSPDLFQKGILPAVNVELSVSRVGGKAQLAVYRDIAGMLKLSYAQFEDLEAFSRFGTRLDDQTQSTITHGERIRSWLKQKPLDHISVIEQITVLFALIGGKFDTVALEQMVSAQLAVRQISSHIPSDISSKILADKVLDDSDKAAIMKLIEAALEPIPKAKAKE